MKLQTRWNAKGLTAQTDPFENAHHRASDRPAERRWNLAARVAFRFFFVYMAMDFIAGGVISLVPGLRFLSRTYYYWWNELMVWIGRTVFHLTPPYLASDAAAPGMISVLCCAIVSALVAVIWSILDRRRPNYDRLQQWFQLMVRFMLAPTMISYGAIKVIPTQMIAPPLLAQIGDLIPAHILWWGIGASPAYESFTGLAELLGGVLLLVPRTALVGALVCFADMLTVFMLNMCYDITVKVGSFRLLLMSIVLVAPHVPRLARFFVLNRRAEAARTPPLFQHKWLNRVPYLLLFVFGVYSVGSNFNRTFERERRFNPPKLPLYGGYSVEEFSVDGKTIPKFTDPKSWRWVFISLRVGKPGELRIEQMIGTAQSYSLDVDRENKKLVLGSFQRNATGGGNARDSQGNFIKLPGSEVEISYVEPGPNVLILEGRLDDRLIHARLKAMPLSAKGTQWVRDPDQ